MFLKLDREGLLYGQVYRALRRQILSGRMRPGSRLPSTRWLALELGISRNTALLAYEQLIAEGYFTTGSHAGTYVAAELPENLTFVAPDRVSRKHATPSAVRLSGYASRIADDPVNAALIREILMRPALP
jgi:GntR family transcriptional regulator / MocR family aminotransferase